MTWWETPRTGFLAAQSNYVELTSTSLYSPFHKHSVVPTKSDSDVILCLQLLSKHYVCTSLELKRIDRFLCINPILWIGLIHKLSINSKSISL